MDVYVCMLWEHLCSTHSTIYITKCYHYVYVWLIPYHINLTRHYVIWCTSTKHAGLVTLTLSDDWCMGQCNEANMHIVIVALCTHIDTHLHTDVHGKLYYDVWSTRVCTLTILNLKIRWLAQHKSHIIKALHISISCDLLKGAVPNYPFTQSLLCSHNHWWLYDFYQLLISHLFTWSYVLESCHC